MKINILYFSYAQGKYLNIILQLLMKICMYVGYVQFIHGVIFADEKFLWKDEINFQSFSTFSCFKYNFVWRFFFFFTTERWKFRNLKFCSISIRCYKIMFKKTKNVLKRTSISPLLKWYFRCEEKFTSYTIHHSIHS